MIQLNQTVEKLAPYRLTLNYTRRKDEIVRKIVFDFDGATTGHLIPLLESQLRTLCRNKTFAKADAPDNIKAKAQRVEDMLLASTNEKPILVRDFVQEGFGAGSLTAEEAAATLSLEQLEKLIAQKKAAATV